MNKFYENTYVCNTPLQYKPIIQAKHGELLNDMYQLKSQMLDDNNGESMFGGDREEENVEEIDFYEILEVPREASTEEIHKAYKLKCLIFHPDKQINLNTTKRKEAEKTFAELQRAHQILVDPCMRRIYDVMGVRGINLEGWQLIDHSSTAENIRKEYEFLCRLRENEIMLQMFNPESNLFAKFSLVGCFQDVDSYGPEFVSMNISQNVDFAIVGSHKIGIGGATWFNEKERGNGTVQFFHKWAYSLGMQQETTVNTSPKMVQLSSRFTFVNTSPGSFLHRYSIVIEPALHYSLLSSSLFPSISAKMIAPLMPGWKGVFTLNLPDNASVSLLYFTLHNQTRFVTSLQISAAGLPSAYVVYHNLNNNDCRWTVQADLSLTEIIPSLSYERRLSQHLQVAFKISLSYPTFLLQSSIKIRTSLSTFEFCFVLCDNQEDVVRAFVKGIVLPFIAFNTAQLIYRRVKNGKKVGE